MKQSIVRFLAVGLLLGAFLTLTNAGVPVPIPGTASPSAPSIIDATVVNISNSRANITFTVNQSDAKTRVYYGTTQSLGEFSNWNNYTGLSRTIGIPSP